MRRIWLWNKQQDDVYETTVALIDRHFERRGLALADFTVERGPKRSQWGIPWDPVHIGLLMEPPDDGELEVWLRVEAQLMSLPDARMLPLYRRLLELNATKLVTCALGVREDQIVLTAELPASWLDDRVFDQVIQLLGTSATDCARSLIGEFGGTAYCDQARA